MPLEHNTAPAALALLKLQQRCPRGRLEHIVDALAAQAGAFEVALGANLAGSALSIVCGDEALRLAAHFFDRDGVFAEILLEADEDDGDAGA